MKNIRNLKIKIKRFLKNSGYPEFLHRFGPKTYKLEDHVSNLLIMQVCRTSLRRTEIIANLFGTKVPTYSALCKSRKRIPLDLWQRLLKLTAGFSSGKVAVDGTGFNKANPSFHYLKRIGNKNPKDYAKLSALLDLETKKFLIMRIRKTPRHDMQDIKYLLKRTDKIKKLYADKGYDSEEIHEFCYWRKIQTYIPQKRNVKHGWARKIQMKKFNKKEYNLRSNVESGFSAIKRKYGNNVGSKRIEGMRVEIFCKGIAHNLNLTKN
jgi:transposase